MTIHIITGGTGFVGRHLVKRLVEMGLNIWILIRPLNNFSTEERAREIFGELLKKYPDSIKIVEGNILEKNLGIAKSELKKLTELKVYVWHCAANLSFIDVDKENIRYTNLQGTINAVNFANTYASRYFHTSTAYVCGNTKTTFFENDLDVGQSFRNEYEKSKFLGEKHVRENVQIACSVFRPSIIIGSTYSGKAAGCTFGYYRFSYMFYTFKKWIINHLQRKTFLARFLIFFGTTHNKDTSELSLPWLYLPCPKGGEVDLIPIEYILDSMIAVLKKEKETLTTYNLTHPQPPQYEMLIKALFKDLGYSKVKFFTVPASIFRMFIMISYYVMIPLRSYIKSTRWYLPYFSEQTRFDHSNVRAAIPIKAHSIDREFIRNINTEATVSIFNKIKNSSSNKAPKNFFNTLNYTLGNEDVSVEVSALKNNANHVYTIAGCGSRVIPLLSKLPKKVTCVDSSKDQLYITELRIETLKQLSLDEFKIFWGFIPSENDKKIRKKLYYSLSLPKKTDLFFKQFFTANNWLPVTYSGRWEKTFNTLSKINRAVVGKNALKIFSFTDLDEQIEYYNSKFPKYRWSLIILILGNAPLFNALLYKGHFPKNTTGKSLFTFYKERLDQLFTRGLARENFFLQMLFLGKITYAQGMPLECDENIFTEAKKGAQTAKVVYKIGDCISTIKSENEAIDFVSLSDSPSYFSKEKGETFMQQLKDYISDDGVVVNRYYIHTPQNINTDGYKNITDSISHIADFDRVNMYDFGVYQKQQI